MQKFLINLILFFLFSLVVIFLIVCLPATPKSSNSLLFISKNKLELLKKIQGPRIIFLGGSNLSFGLDSQLIKDSVGINPINMGLHASLGLNFMMLQYLGHAKKGDIVVLIPEYHQYLGNLSEGSDGEELARMVFDVDFHNFHNLNNKQRFHVFSSLPKIIKSRFTLGDYIGYEFDFIYSKYVYNQFGDIDSKYLIKKRDFKSEESFNNASINYYLFQKIVNFKNRLKKNGGQLIISFPGYQDTSYFKSIDKINEIYSVLNKKKFDLLGTPEMFRMNDSFMLNSPYHLNNLGVIKRTYLLINELKYFLQKKKN
jgi:hypothetical protein